MKKTLLCYNMLVNSRCMYGNKCKYAHGLKNQYIKPINKFVYDAIINNNDLSNINLEMELKLYNRLLTMTNLCENCAKQKCHGGYNCKNGAIDDIYLICYNDLIGGNCNNINCDRIHLTKQGLKPYNNFIKKYPIPGSTINDENDSDIEEIDL